MPILGHSPSNSMAYTPRMQARLGLLLVGITILSASPAMATGQVGEPGADFTLMDSETFTEHTLSDYRGEVVLLHMAGYG